MGPEILGRKRKTAHRLWSPKSPQVTHVWLSLPHLVGGLPPWEGDQGATCVGPQPPTLLSTQAPSARPQPEGQQQNEFLGRDSFSLLPYLKFPRQNFSSEKLEPVIIHLRTCNFFFKKRSPEGEVSQLGSVSYTLCPGNEVNGD